mmetsp:Transcript_49707/g.116076  ORF Transcript_49707/g.116076 Transcript_49707/m.116076 type:complete len:434 (+) Transcript_49707:2-1303(+)
MLHPARSRDLFAAFPFGPLSRNNARAMPLNEVWGFTAFVDSQKLPWQLITMFILAMFNFAVNLALVCRWGWLDAKMSREMCDKDKRPAVPYSVELVRTIVYIPAGISSVCVVVMLRPATAFVLELCMAILSCVVVGSMTRYFLETLGEPPLPHQLLSRVPKRRWWCGFFCGGVNDTLPGMGLLWSKEPHRVTLRDVHRATSMVRIFIIVFISVNSFQLSLSMVPGSVAMTDDGWCVSISPVSSPAISTCVTVVAVTASFIGMAGFGVVSAAISSVLDQKLQNTAQADVADRKLIQYFRVASQSKTVMVYMLLPLTLPICMGLPLGTQAVTLPVPKLTAIQGTSEHWHAKGETLECPVFDKEVCAHLLYSFFVSLGMLYVGIRNHRIFRPADHYSDRLLKVMASFDPDGGSPSEGNAEDDESGDDGQSSDSAKE